MVTLIVAAIRIATAYLALVGLGTVMEKRREDKLSKKVRAAKLEVEISKSEYEAHLKMYEKLLKKFKATAAMEPNFEGVSDVEDRGLLHDAFVNMTSAKGRVEAAKKALTNLC